ncbi:hypothetical protein [Labrenzia sp. MBR-25]
MDDLLAIQVEGEPTTTGTPSAPQFSVVGSSLSSEGGSNFDVIAFIILLQFFIISSI